MTPPRPTVEAQSAMFRLRSVLIWLLICAAPASPPQEITGRIRRLCVHPYAITSAARASALASALRIGNHRHRTHARS
ncbi:hypothetical protein GZL_04303 [Streptomyces sp. 769]|nr:hypothetical protein GZL_04303 [Streptomyces sp. 769]